MKSPLFIGSAVAIITPFNDNGVDYDTLGDLIEFQIKNSTDAIVICGTTGEASTMPDEEHIAVVKFTVDKVNKRVPVIAGSGSNDTRHAIKLAQELEKAALETLGTESILFLTAFNRYINALGGVMDIAESKDLPQLFERVDESIVAVCQRYAQYVQRLGTQVNFEEILNPSWMFPETADTDTSGQ